MKKLAGVVIVLGVLGALVYAFRDPLLAADADRMTAHMFVARDTDDYDPGVPVGAMLPAIRARYQDHEITGLGDFMGKRGLAIFVNRSVDW